MTRKILLLWLLIASSACYAKEDNFKAERMASRFVIEHPKVFHKSASASCALSQYWQTDDYAVFNVSGGGWVAVTGGESSNSVIAYSDSGSLQADMMPQSTQGLLTGCSTAIVSEGSGNDYLYK